MDILPANNTPEQEKRFAILHSFAKRRMEIRALHQEYIRKLDTEHAEALRITHAGLVCDYTKDLNAALKRAGLDQ